jgi:site-specific DNA recombinase
VRQDHLDAVVWEQIIGLLEDDRLIQSEIERRRELAQTTNPLRKREEGLRREQARLENHVERLVTAYQEGLVTLAQLRQRMPDLQQRTQAVASELQSLEMAAVDQTRYLQLAETLNGFRIKLCARAETLGIKERQQIVRLLVKEILVGADILSEFPRFRITHWCPVVIRPWRQPSSEGRWCDPCRPAAYP